MKLRIHEQSIRLRVVPQELTCLRNTGQLLAELTAPEAGAPLLRYGVMLRKDLQASAARLAPGEILVEITEADLETLQHSPQESIHVQVAFPGSEENASRLAIYVEKDRRPHRG